MGNNFLNRTPRALQIRKWINKLDYIKLKSFYTTEETITRLKRLLSEWEKIFASCSFHKKLISRIYMELKKLNVGM
jgi:hypothetical protein